MSLGFKYEIREGATIVTQVDAGGPADRAGIKTDDKIMEVDGLTTAGGETKLMHNRSMSPSTKALVVRSPGQDVLSILTGEPGDTVTMTVQTGQECSSIASSKALQSLPSSSASF